MGSGVSTALPTLVLSPKPPIPIFPLHVGPLPFLHPFLHPCTQPILPLYFPSCLLLSSAHHGYLTTRPTTVDIYRLLKPGDYWKDPYDRPFLAAPNPHDPASTLAKTVTGDYASPATVTSPGPLNSKPIHHGRLITSCVAITRTRHSLLLHLERGTSLQFWRVLCCKQRRASLLLKLHFSSLDSAREGSRKHQVPMQLIGIHAVGMH